MASLLDFEAVESVSQKMETSLRTSLILETWLDEELNIYTKHTDPYSVYRIYGLCLHNIPQYY